jgi:hypothetical protein
MLEYIFLDFRLWIYLPATDQLLLYSTFLELAKNDAKSWFQRFLPQNRMLYFLKVFFWSKLTNRVSGTRPSVQV